MTMDRYNCNGWLFITLNDTDLTTANIRITHHRSHHPYTDISISPDIGKIVERLKDLPAAKVCVKHACFAVDVFLIVIDI